MSVMGRPKGQTKARKMIIVNAALSPPSMDLFTRTCHERGMTAKSLLGRLIAWLANLDKTEQAIVLGQVDSADEVELAAILRKRR